MKLFKRLFLMIMTGAALTMAVSSCNDDRSYADLLKLEDQSVNHFLSNQRLELSIPADSVFEVGPQAPYYQLDEDGTVFMQVLSTGTTEKAETGDRIYFRFMRYNLNYYEEGESMTGSGNADNVSPDAVGPTFFVYGNMTNTNSYQWGPGIQMPMRFLGYDAKVNLIIKSRSGLISEESSVVPYLYTITYYKPLT